MKSLEKTIEEITYKAENEFISYADMAKIAFIAGAKAHKNKTLQKKSMFKYSDRNWTIDEKRRKSSLFFKKLI
jgi:hypothetical protein